MIKKINTLLFFLFVFSLFSFGNKAQALNDCGTAAFKPDWKCTDINAENNIFNPATACVTGHCDGGSNIRCCRQDCDAGEQCMDKAPGLTCVSRGVCSGSRACCKPTSAGNNTNTNNTNFGGSGTRFENPLRFNSVEDFLSQIMGAIQKIIVTLSLLVIVYGAVLYVISAGSKMVDDAKKAITGALIGLALALAAPSFLKEIAILVGWGVEDTQLATAFSLTDIALRVLNFLLGSLGLLATLMMVIGGGMYLTSAGDPGQVETGKKIFRYSIMGILAALASMVLVTQIAQFFVR